MAEIRVLIADDQVLFARSLKVVLQAHGRNAIRVVGISYDGRQAVEDVGRERPDIVLLDVRMPGMDGVAAAQEISAKYPATKVVMLTTFSDDEYVHQALANGAVGYLLKTIDPDELVTAIKAVKAGTFLVSPVVGRRLVDRVRVGSPPEHVKTDMAAEVNYILSRFPILARREAEVLCMLAANRSNQEIAASLSIAEQTVRNYVSRIYDKLGVSDRAHAIRLVSGSGGSSAAGAPGVDGT